MVFLELIALAIVGVYVLARSLGHAQPRRFLLGFALVSAASWLAEESSLLLYDLYAYNPAWSLFLGHVPAVIILIWPAVIHSAWELASQLAGPGRRRVALAAGALVGTDAALIEPVAARAGLWTWEKSGLFEVPPIVILGWASFAFFCVFVLEQGRGSKGVRGPDLLVLVLPVLGTHLLLLAAWWAGLRWVQSPMAPSLAAGAAWVVSLVLVYAIGRQGTGRRVQRKTLLLRLPAAMLLFALLVFKAGGSGGLALYALAFAPPYLTLMAQQYLDFGPLLRSPGATRPPRPGRI